MAANRTSAAANRVQAATNADEVRYAASMVAKPRHAVVKASQALDPMTEIGTTGLRQWGGFVLEEWLLQLQGRRAAWHYREMMDNNPVIGAILYAIEWLARGVDYRVEEGNDPAAAQFVEENMYDMSHTWGDLISEVLSMLPYGWDFEEITYKKRNGYQPDPPFDPDAEVRSDGTREDDSSRASSAFNDGKIGWRKFSTRAQETLMRWHFDGYSGIQAMEQVDWHGGNHVIPIQKAVLFRARARRNNPEGYSILRTAFTSYTYLKGIQAVEAIGIERDLAGIPVLTPPEGTDIYGPGQADILAKAMELVTSIRRDEYEGVVLPGAGWVLELLSAAGSRQINTDEIVRRYEQRIATAMLADFILIGQDAVGSFAMVDVKSNLFAVALDGILDLICEAFNKYAIPRLLTLNGMDVSDPPRIEHASAGSMDLEKVSGFLWQLSGAGMPIPWSAELVKSLLQGANLPANIDEHTPLPENAVGPPQLPPGDDPFAREAHEQEDAPAPPSDGQPQPLTKAEQHSGAMVALYPPEDVARQLAQPGGEPAKDLHLTLAFLGDAVHITDPDRLRGLVAEWASSTPPLTGHISGAGLFTRGPEPASYASPDVPDLPAHRQRLVTALESSGFPPSREHGFTPHITLAYGATDLPQVHHHEVRFDRATLKLGGARHDFPLIGITEEPVGKADREETDNGTVVQVGPVLTQRARFLTVQLEKEIEGALAELGSKAASAYLACAGKPVEKASTRLQDRQRLVQRVMRALNLRQWVADHLGPLLKNHAARVTTDTQRAIQAEIEIEVRVADEDAERIASAAGEHLGLRDIEPQIRAAIRQAIEQGFKAGENPTRTAQRIQSMVPAGRFVNAGSKYRAQLIAREETANAQRAATLALYESNPRVAAVRLRDGIYGPPRSDQVCIGRDGEEVPIGEARAVLPEHLLCTLGFEPVIAATMPTDAGDRELAGAVA